jgi:uncharacterized protein YodC (DUF2158 family)
MSNEIKAGDIVELKSFGPKTRVEKTEVWNKVMTAWCKCFDGKKPQNACRYREQVV